MLAVLMWRNLLTSLNPSHLMRQVYWMLNARKFLQVLLTTKWLLIWLGPLWVWDSWTGSIHVSIHLKLQLSFPSFPPPTGKPPEDLTFFKIAFFKVLSPGSKLDSNAPSANLSGREIFTLRHLVIKRWNMVNMLEGVHSSGSNFPPYPGKA